MISKTNRVRVIKPLTALRTHGLQWICFPQRSSIIDTTIGMDIENNPGPEYQQVSLEPYANRTAVVDSKIRSYGRSNLISLRKNKCALSKDTIYSLKNFSIFRYRGRRAGKSLKWRKTLPELSDSKFKQRQTETERKKKKHWLRLHQSGRKLLLSAPLLFQSHILFH